MADVLCVRSELPDLTTTEAKNSLSPGADRLRHEAHVRDLAPDQRLFTKGEIKTHVYLIELGAICIEQERTGSDIEVQTAFPGDFIGWGFLRNHIYTARATMRSRVRCFSLDVVADLVASDVRLQALQAAATKEEFVARRDMLVALQLTPAQRLAAYFVAVSRANQYEGGDPFQVSISTADDALRSFVSPEGALTAALIDLEVRGLIRRRGFADVQLIDLGGLERFCEHK